MKELLKSSEYQSLPWNPNGVPEPPEPPETTPETTPESPSGFRGGLSYSAGVCKEIIRIRNESLKSQRKPIKRQENLNNILENPRNP